MLGMCVSMIRSRVVRSLGHVCAPRLGRSCIGPSPYYRASRSVCSTAVQQQGNAVRRAPWTLFFSRGSQFASGYSALTPKSLDSILKVESVKYASAEDLTEIWNEYHIGRGHISAVMGTPLYDAFRHRAKACPLFVVPVKRGQGYVTLLVQAQIPHMLFTGLADYRARGADATPYLTVTHYQEFAQTKGVVLVRGDVVLTSKLTDAEARTALEVAHSFYLDTSRYRLVTKFNREADEFDFREVLRELGMSAGP